MRTDEMNILKPLGVHIGVQNFGPVEQATLDLRPLTVFVGESNTGKTYLTLLIYALHRTFEGFVHSLPRPFKDAGVFSKQLKRCFGVASVPELVRFSDSANTEMRISLQVGAGDHVVWTFDMQASRAGIQETLDIKQDGFLPEQNCEAAKVYYLPAARRGLMKTHEMSANSLGKQAASGKIKHLSEVEAAFLKQIISYKERNGSSDEMMHIAKTLAAEVLQGEIEVKHPSVQMSPEFLYRPQNAEKALRLSLSSSMVSELAPLVLFVQGIVRPGDLLIIEEPESHLHPGAQVKVAYALARLVRAGVNIVITTHSDWLLQQLGNLIREGELNKLRKKRTELENWLVKEEIGTWWFRTDKPVTEIPFERIDGIGPPEYHDVGNELYDIFANLEQQFLDRGAVSEKK